MVMGEGVVYEGAALQSPSVVLYGILELWICKGLQYCTGQWNMLKRTLSFTVAGVWLRGHAYNRPMTKELLKKQRVLDMFTLNM